MSKGGSTQKTTETKVVPKYVEDAQKGLLSKAETITDPWLDSAPTETVAGFNADQLKSFDMAEDLADTAFSTAKPTVGSTATTNNWVIPTVTPLDENKGQVTGSKITKLMNPYRKDVVNSTIKTLGRERDETRADIGARNASSAAFGGSRQALQDTELDRNYLDEVADTTADLMYKGYDRATDTALANADQAQKAGIANQDAANDINKYFYGQYNDMLGKDADRALKGTELEDTLLNNEQKREYLGLTALNTAGKEQQDLEQKYLDQPIEMLKLLGSVVPGEYGGTTTKTEPNKSPSTLQTIGGLAASIIPAIWSDERAKTNQEYLGIDPDTGLPMYAYDYKSDIDAAEKSGGPMPPKRVGPMARDIEDRRPDAVKKVGRTKVVKNLGFG